MDFCAKCYETRKDKGMKVAFLTLGCKVNFYETERMMEQFQRLGFDVVDFTEPSDIYIVNTCTVTNMADRKSRQMLHRAKKKNPESLVVAVGCYVESGEAQLREDSAVDAFFYNRDKEHMAERFIEYFQILPEKTGTGSRNVQHERTRAYLKIQDGCNQFCTYCMIPYVRGRGKLVSMPEEEVVHQAEELAAKGYQEVVLTGIHLSSYGVDYSDAYNFLELEGKPLLSVIRQVSELSGIQRIRLGSLEPRIITESFVQELAEMDKVCPHFHLSLQSGCDTVLQRMNRHYTSAEYKEKIAILRKYFDMPAVTTDVIAGFPGETEKEFEQTREFLRDIGFSDLHIFPYSPRTGTRAAAMSDQISPEVKKKRCDLLIADTEGYRKKYTAQFLGRQEKILFEEIVVSEDEKYLVGHNERYVRIGVPLWQAEKEGYGENQIHEVTVRHSYPASAAFANISSEHCAGWLIQ